jgi:hypothetical protein
MGPDPPQGPGGFAIPSKTRSRVGNVLVLLVATLVALAGGEVVLRLLAPDSGFAVGREYQWFRQGDARMQDAFVTDPELGFRPRFGSALYSEHGTLFNDYPLEKTAGRRRLLFLGDSVTARGCLQEALAGLDGGDGFEYWNAGVESYNVVQEAAYYHRLDPRIRPDHVILLFHNNDFSPTPVAFRDRGRLVVYSPELSLGPAGAWAFQHSRVYRLLLGSWVRIRRQFADPMIPMAERTARDLASLRDELAGEGIRFSVILLPAFKPPGSWSELERRSRARALELLDAGGYRYFDLLPVLEDAAAAGVPLEETPGDFWHPSEALCTRFAGFLAARGLLDGRPRG